MSKLVLSPPVASPFRFSVGLTRAAPCKTQPSGVNGSRKLTSCRQGGFLPTVVSIQLPSTSGTVLRPRYTFQSCK